MKSKAEFIALLTGAAASWPDLSQLGEDVATVRLKGDARVLVKRFNLATCPKPVQVGWGGVGWGNKTGRG